MALIAPRVTAGLPAEDAQKLQYALSGSHDITVFVDGTVHRLPPGARDAVVDLLGRFSRGEAVTVSSVQELLTTSQAADLAGISHTYLRNMTDRGEIRVEYRGTHRRIRLADIMAWLETQKRNAPPEGAAASPPDGAAARAAGGGNDGGTDGS
jgi:excisionase family DNA binding protein